MRLRLPAASATLPNRNRFMCSVRTQTEPSRACRSTIRMWSKVKTQPRTSSCSPAIPLLSRNFPMIRHLLLISLFMPLPLLAQVEAAPAATTAAQPAVEDTQMQTPPPVSTGSYPSTPLSEDRSNYLRSGLTFNTAYSDNVLGSTNGHPVSDVSYSIWPTIALDETTARMHWVFSYSPGFTFYQRVSDLNQADQNLGIQFRYRLSPHLTLDLHDTLQKSSNVLNNPDLISSNGVQGNPAGQTVEIVPPVADRLNNVGSALLSYQFSPRDMVGASGSFTNLDRKSTRLNSSH